ncbi:MAG: MFS transporter, partial [Bacilli bacterium]|nr:MFS transporter [Bacilli bacterium]
MKTNTKTKINLRTWLSIIIFGLVGQIAWIVENMYFAKFAQDIFISDNNAAYLSTTLMVILSAIMATATTIFSGWWSDKLNKRKPFISFGYIAWGITIMLFSLIPITPTSKTVGLIIALLVAFDCIMTFAGSTANDAAFNAWVTDNTDSTNRGLVNSILSIFPLIAVVIVMIGLGGIYDSNKKLFFIVLGIIPIVTGIIAMFLIKDNDNVVQREETVSSIKDVFYGFQIKVIKENKMMYVALLTMALIGISQQTFFSYLINFLVRTLNLGDSGFIIPMAVIIIGSGLFTAILGILFDKFGRKHFYIPLVILTTIGIFSFFLLKYFMVDNNLTIIGVIIMYIGGVIMMGGILSLNASLTATFQDYIPKGKEGSFQGIRMMFMVLLPMIIGPIISLLIG